MARRTDITLAIALLAATTPASAQDIPQVPLFDGALVLRADAGFLDSAIEPDSVLVTFWRPILFGSADKPIGGRMDCRLGGVRETYSDEKFDVQARYDEDKMRRLNAGLTDESEVFDNNGTVARVEITGRANDPHRHYVLSYIAMRDGETLYDMRLNCEFKHLQNPGAVDYAAVMHQYVDLAVPMGGSLGMAAPNAIPESHG